MTAAEGAWLAFHVPVPAAPFRLFCLPHAGGGASLFHSWGAELSPLVEVCPVQLPGREGRIREPAVPSLRPLVARLADALSGYLDRRYAIFGHSMGALLGFELTRELGRRGLPAPAHLFVASYCAPHLQRREDRAGTVRREAAKRITGVQAVPAEIKGELLDLLVPTLEADTRLCEGYEYVEEGALSCPLTAFRGNTDYVPADDLAGWRELTRGPFQTQTFLGDHFFLRETPRGVVQAVRRALAKSA
ncbi:alpha/beta fold hydrolase [Sorangium sp. So ce726]|uniref:thioesterase II family protein n=1 Tax=Sorangium sp. So ce726 TaxID=3133319 RepID=UPI003F623FE3